jgi:hypothetical protein
MFFGGEVASNHRVLVRALTVVLILAIACREDPPATVTIEPAAPRPASTTSTIGMRPIVTTSGSPLPGRNAKATVQRVRLSDDSIEMQKLLPRGRNTFRFSNESSNARTVVISANSAKPLFTAALAPGEVIYVAVDMVESDYSLQSISKVGRRGVRLRTYVPGEVIEPAVGTPRR